MGVDSRVGCDGPVCSCGSGCDDALGRASCVPVAFIDVESGMGMTISRGRRGPLRRLTCERGSEERVEKFSLLASCVAVAACRRSVEKPLALVARQAWATWSDRVAGVCDLRGGLRISYSENRVDPRDAFEMVRPRPPPGVGAIDGVRKVSSSTKETGRLSSCGGGSEITESAPTVGMNPSGGSGAGGRDMDMDAVRAREVLRSGRISMGSGERGGALGRGRDD